MTWLFATALKSLYKFALFEILGIFGWSMLQRSDWLIWTNTKNENKKSKKNPAFERTLTTPIIQEKCAFSTSSQLIDNLFYTSKLSGNRPPHQWLNI